QIPFPGFLPSEIPKTKSPTHPEEKPQGFFQGFCPQKYRRQKAQHTQRRNLRAFSRVFALRNTEDKKPLATCRPTWLGDLGMKC
ncbi:MAG: hypothetical protein QXG33_04500, partial [Candidatus Anstonellales archaeon]